MSDVAQYEDSPASAPETHSDAAITYASFASDRLSGARGGWRIGQQVHRDPAGLSDTEIKQLLEVIPSQLITDVPIPLYASAEEKQAFIHRTAWLKAPWSPRDQVLVHSAPAGKDSSGRTGNVFSVAHVFREGTRGLRVSPAELLKSPDLPAPFGAPEVNAVNLSSTELRPNPQVAPEQVFAVLVDPATPGGGPLLDILCYILDALSAGAQVILGDDPQRAWLWIAAVNFATHPGRAKEIYWSTYERASALPARQGEGFSVIVVPRDDIPLIRSQYPERITIDVNQGVTRGEWGNDRASASAVGVPGSEFEVSSWSELLRYLVTTAGATAELTVPQVDTGAYADMVAARALDDVPAALAAVGGPLRETLRQAGSRSQLTELVQELPEELRDQLQIPVIASEKLAERELAPFDEVPDFTGGAGRLPGEGHPTSGSDWKSAKPSASPEAPPGLTRGSDAANPFATDPGEKVVVEPEQPQAQASGIPAGCAPAFVRETSPGTLAAIHRAILESGANWIRDGRSGVETWLGTMELLLADARQGPVELRQTQQLVFGSAVAALVTDFRAQQFNIRLLPWWRIDWFSARDRQEIQEHAWQLIHDTLAGPDGTWDPAQLTKVRENLASAREPGRLPEELIGEATQISKRLTREMKMVGPSAQSTAAAQPRAGSWLARRRRDQNQK